MKILVTGAKGFVGRNLIAELRNQKFTDIMEFDIDTDIALLDDYCRTADFIFHLAGVNRPMEQSEFMEGNFGFTSILINKLQEYGNKSPVMISSSIQAKLENPYGRSKKAGEDLLIQYSVRTGAKVLIYRFPNVFGKWSRPNYNSAVATFCYNAANDLPIQVNDPEVVMNLVYIDDLVSELINALGGKDNNEGIFCSVKEVYSVKLGKIAELVQIFNKCRESLDVPDMHDPFTKKLFSTYLSYLPRDRFGYELKMNIDDRGSFTEFIKTQTKGQISVNVSKPGIVKGNHWHNSKHEKFLVVSGKGVIRFRPLGEDEIIEYYVNSEKMTVIDIPPGYTHNIENLGGQDMVTIMWANEPFDPQRPDTYYLEV